MPVPESGIKIDQLNPTSASVTGASIPAMIGGLPVRITPEQINDLATSFNAAAVQFTPAGGVGATNVQAAIVEVDSEKASKANNLSDLASASTARTNLGATGTGGALFTAASVAAARTTLGLVWTPVAVVNLTATSGADITFPTGSRFLRFTGFWTPATNGSNLYARFGIGGGGVFEAGASDYEMSYGYFEATTAASVARTAANFMKVSGSCVDSYDQPFDILISRGTASRTAWLISDSVGHNGTHINRLFGHNYRAATGSQTAVRLFPSGGNIGEIRGVVEAC